MNKHDYHHDRRKALFTAIALSVAPFSVQASDYPSKPIRLVVPSAPGGALDTLGRLIALQMQKQFGVVVVVEAKPGASGSIGVQYAMRSAPDGYTFMISVPDAVSIYPMVNEKVTYNWNRELTPLVQVGVSSTVYVVGAKSPVTTVAEFIALSKQENLNYATQGAGSSGHLLMEAFRTATGTNLTHIPYKGIAPAIQSLITGETAIISSSPTSVASFVESGQLKVLATTSRKRAATMPNVPTMAEQGYPELTLETWFGTFAPAGLNPDIGARLIQMVTAAVESPAFREQAARFALGIDPISGGDFRKRVVDDTAFWKAIVDRSKVKAD